jgi:hypothetical protein
MIDVLLGITAPKKKTSLINASESNTTGNDGEFSGDDEAGECDDYSQVHRGSAMLCDLRSAYLLGGDCDF